MGGAGVIPNGVSAAWLPGPHRGYSDLAETQAIHAVNILQLTGQLAGLKRQYLLVPGERGSGGLATLALGVGQLAAQASASRKRTTPVVDDCGALGLVLLINDPALIVQSGEVVQCLSQVTQLSRLRLVWEFAIDLLNGR
jgi:hypothetical protein